jgi:hypothetical protein
MVLHMARLDVLGIARNERHVFALFVLQADLPTSKKFWPRLNVLKSWILEWSLKLAAYNVFKAIVGDDVMVSALVFDRDSLLHKTSVLELVAIDERSTETSLLIGGKTLCEVGIDFAGRVALAWERPLE